VSSYYYICVLILALTAQPCGRPAPLRALLLHPLGANTSLASATTATPDFTQFTADFTTAAGNGPAPVIPKSLKKVFGISPVAEANAPAMPVAACAGVRVTLGAAQHAGASGSVGVTGGGGRGGECLPPQLVCRKRGSGGGGEKWLVMAFEGGRDRGGSVYDAEQACLWSLQVQVCVCVCVHVMCMCVCVLTPYTAGASQVNAHARLAQV
jgi:hypothetical protein